MASYHLTTAVGLAGGRRDRSSLRVRPELLDNQVATPAEVWGCGDVGRVMLQGLAVLNMFVVGNSRWLIRTGCWW